MFQRIQSLISIALTVPEFDLKLRKRVSDGLSVYRRDWYRYLMPLKKKKTPTEITQYQLLKPSQTGVACSQPPQGFFNATCAWPSTAAASAKWLLG